MTFGRWVARLARLSARERQVLERLVSGLPSKMIAHDLGVGLSTVGTYRARAKHKMMAASSRARANEKPRRDREPRRGLGSNPSLLGDEGFRLVCETRAAPRSSQ